VADVPPIHGSCDPRFARVREALVENFRSHGEVGAAVALSIDGKPVVDLWAGWMDRERKHPWRRDTLVNVFSVGKPMAAACLLRLVERDELDLDAPVARYWPEFAAAGKDSVTLRMLLCHQAGLPAIRRLLPALAMYDWGRMTAALAAEPPWWPPGTRHGYHVNTFGFLVGEIVRRVSGETIGAFFGREVAGPLDADFHFGVGPEDDHRIAESLLPEDGERAIDLLLAAEAEHGAATDDERRLLVRRTYLNPPGASGFATVNTRAWRAAEMPSANGHASARGIARIYSAFACGGAVGGIRLLEAETVAHAAAEAAAGPDVVLGRPSRFGLGFQLPQPGSALARVPRGFGHFGAGGAVGFADPEARLAFGYAMNQPGPRWQNPRNRGLIDAVYDSL